MSERLPCGHDAAQQWWGRCRKCGAAAEGSEPLDVERLARALEVVFVEKWPKVGRIPDVPVTVFGGYAEDIAAAYASQTSESPTMVTLGEGATPEDVERFRERWLSCERCDYICWMQKGHDGPHVMTGMEVPLK